MANRQAPQIKVTSIMALANAILTMHYGDLMEVASDFAQMCTDDAEVRKRPKSPADFASLLYDWAEAQSQP